MRLLMQTAPLTLDAVAQQFSSWRLGKKSKFERIPSRLKELVRQLIAHYPQHRITKTLKISGTFINQLRSGSKNSVSIEQTEQLDFIPFRLVNKDDDRQSADPVPAHSPIQP